MMLSYLAVDTEVLPPSDLCCLDQDPKKSLRGSCAKPVITCGCSSAFLHHSVSREFSDKRENTEFSLPTFTEMH